VLHLNEEYVKKGFKCPSLSRRCRWATSSSLHLQFLRCVTMNVTNLETMAAATVATMISTTALRR